MILDQNGDPVLEKIYSVDTGTVLTINTKTKKLYNGSKELIDISSSFTPQKMEFMKAGGSYAVVFGKKLQTFAANTLGVEPKPVFAKSKEVSIKDRGLTAVEKIFNKKCRWYLWKYTPRRFLRPRQRKYCRVPRHYWLDDFSRTGNDGCHYYLTLG